MRKNHDIIRTKNQWGSYGKPGDPDYGTLRFIIIKDIHDDHLENIIYFIQERKTRYTLSTLQTMVDEQEYRRIHKIRVPFKFG